VCASRVIEFVVFFMIHLVLNPVFVDLTSREKIIVTSYTTIFYSSPNKFLKECTIRVIQVTLTCSLWLSRVPRFEVLHLFVGHTESLCEEFIFFRELKERVDHYTQVCCV